jgi:heme b synthase
MQFNHSRGPRLIFWELTTGCNLRCQHCRASATELQSPNDLSHEESLRVIDQIGAYAPLILVLSGGEPLMRRDLFDLVRRAQHRGLRTALATNGTLIDAAMARRIQAAGIERVAISLDGTDPVTHDNFRGQPGAWAAAVRGLNLMRDLGVPTQINTTVTRHNATQLPRMLRLARELGVQAFHLFLLVPVGCGLTIHDDQAVSSEVAEELLRWFYDRSLETSLELKATCAPQYYRIARQRRAELREEGVALPPTPANGMHAMTKGCLAGTGVCFISHLGQVFPCGYLPLEAGDLRRQRFREIWERSELFGVLRDTSHLEGRCGVCEFQKVCSGCRARAYGATGNYLGEEPTCNWQPAAWVSEIAPVA